MSTRYFRRKTILAKMESSYGVDPSPTGAANAVLVRNAVITPHKGTYVDRGIVQSYLGHQPQLLVMQEVTLAFEIEVAGSGTAGVVPAWGVIMRACGFSELALAAAATGTAQAGAASAITLAAAGSSVSDEAYRGMTITTTGGTGSGQSRVISTYNGTSKLAAVSQPWLTPPDVTTNYSIGAQVAYLPISSGMESLTLYFNMDGKQHKIQGCRGTFDIEMSPKAIPIFKVTMTGLFATPTDTALPAVTLTGWKLPVYVGNANTSGFNLHGYTAIMNTLTVTLGNNVVHRSLVGTEDIQLSDRVPVGKVGIEDPTVAAKDYFAAVTAATLDAMNITHGTAAGNIVRLHTPQTQLTNPNFADKDGGVGLDLDTRFVPNLGNDELVIQVA